MDILNEEGKPDISSYDPSWDEWRTEQVQTITHILSTVFKVEDEARQMHAPSRLLRRSSIASPKDQAAMRQKLKQIRQQISEYEEMLKLGLKRVDIALEKIDSDPFENRPKPTSKKFSRLKTVVLPKISMALRRIFGPFFRFF